MLILYINIIYLRCLYRSIMDKNCKLIYNCQPLITKMIKTWLIILYRITLSLYHIITSYQCIFSKRESFVEIRYLFLRLKKSEHVF